MVDVAVFASGNGSNFQNLVEYKSEIYRVKILIVDRKNAYAIERGKKLGIETVYVNIKKFENKELYEKHILEILEKKEIKFIILGGYMKIISPVLLNKFRNKIINIHPSYLPNFPGKSAIEDVYKKGEKETGVTIHFVDEGIDTGKIIYQEKIKINIKWTLEELENEIHRVEHRIYPKVIEKIVGGEI
ncbi:phosphoribosylglycinamide formyltransferase-1 [Cetobacterium ceti]|uniref:Phosphoribosylglycinamide formyltransferase n=1 Tax=Cetobacterium ceti TaxID=180163 RepID=A0A1T4KEC3_9FUSO|nr:phosphoribosylglycinamide formyltransferase [Cetobacterium ceti]SJZ40693.1 phosphoribosylglycinamide formyltransferase-1 [Cetobacterium ceti]